MDNYLMDRNINIIIEINFAHVLITTTSPKPNLVIQKLSGPETAIAHYQQAIHLKPDYAEAHQNLGVTHIKLGQIPQALAAFKDAIALYEKTNPSEAQRLRQALNNMGFKI